MKGILQQQQEKKTVQHNKTNCTGKLKSWEMKTFLFV